MTWMITASGREHHLQGASALLNVMDVGDIAHALSLINRFTGHTTRPYSVAEHSLLVADLAEAAGASPVVQMAALIHDAHEAYTGDVSTPVKWAIGQPWESFEHAEAMRMQHQFGLRSATTASRAQIRRWDLEALATERRDLTAYMPGISAPWAILDTPGHEVPPCNTVRLNSLERESVTWQEWRDAFAQRLQDLRDRVRQLQVGAA